MDNRLVNERKTYPLPIEALTVSLYGGKEKYASFCKGVEFLEKDDFLVEKDFSYYDMSREQLRERTLAKIDRIASLKHSMEDQELFQSILSVLNQIDYSLSMRLLVDFGLFFHALEGGGVHEQIDEYIKKVNDFRLFGCFAMTELGNGSYLQSLETTATYDKNTEEFIIHSPTLTSTKWWIGGVSQSATHGVVFAKLIIDGKDHGTHSFIVQLRDEKFDVMPGMEIGDVGPKRGRNGLDNGWIRFNECRIPRNHMLMKWAEVTKEGEYIPSDLPQLAYGALIGGRVSIILEAIRTVKIALTIATRYCTIRDQQKVKGKALLDYTVQQERLIGALCGVYAYHFTAEKVACFNEKVVKELDASDISHLKELHFQVAQLKAFCLQWGNDAMNQAILSMGGQGYSRLAGVPDLLNDFAVLLPGEGDVIVMAQQAAAFLIKAKRAGTLKYLSNKASVHQNLESHSLLKAAEFAAIKLVDVAYLRLEEELSHFDEQEAWNNCQIELIEAANADMHYTLIKNFYEKIESFDPELSIHMKNLGDLFALRWLNECVHVFYENGYFNPNEGEKIRAKIRNLYAAIRPYVSQWVDALGIPDIMLRSPLGRYDGDLYQHFFDAANSIKTSLKPEHWERHLSQ